MPESPPIDPPAAPSASPPPAAPHETGPRAVLVRAGRRVRAFLASLRLRFVWWFVVLLALTTIGSILVVRQVLVTRLDARIETELRQEVEEVRRLADGNDPETGEPFGTDVERIFEVFLDRNVPTRHETIAAFVDGEPIGQVRGDETPPLGEAETAGWPTVEQPARGGLDTADGRVEYLAVPFLIDGQPSGVFVVAIHRDLARGETDAAALGAAVVGLLVLVIGSLLAVRLADRVLAPVRLVSKTAQTITETDLSQRIPITGYDEINELAATFNAMLDRLEAAFAAQRRFIDDASHELRTPITIIQGHLDVLGDDPEDRARTKALLDEELDRVRRMIDDLLTLARAERPDFLHLAPVDVGDLTGRVLDKARGLGDRAWSLDGRAEGIAALDGQRLTQACLQLAENAVRHTEPGAEIALGSAWAAADADAADEAVANAAIDGAPGALEIWVRDTGPGVEPDQQARIFERFYRGRDGRRRAEGSGLGLSIVAAIAEAHGGWVDLDSAPGRGATFTIVIPLVGGATE